MASGEFSYSHGHLEIFSRPGPPKPSCRVCKTFDPGLSHADRALFIAERNGGILSVSIKTNLDQLDESARLGRCCGCALLHASFSPFLTAVDGIYPLEISIRYDEWSRWESDIPGSGLFGAEVELKTGAGLGYRQPDAFEFFSVQGMTVHISSPS